MCIHVKWGSGVVRRKLSCLNIGLLAISGFNESLFDIRIFYKLRSGNLSTFIHPRIESFDCHL